MAATIELSLPKPGRLVGVRKMELLLDGEVNRNLAFGESYEVLCEPGPHTASIVLYGLLTRRSKPLRFHAGEYETIRINARYNRLLGTITLAQEKN